MSPRIDLRSDTVTQPTRAMRDAMARAPVGDDVYGEDPTVNRLQEHVAELLGTEAALFVPSGTMANQIALKVLTQPGDSVLVGGGAHNYLFESGAAGALAGVQHDILPGNGLFSADAVKTSYRPDNHHVSPTTVVSVENTHNFGGGLVWPRDTLSAVLATARALGLRTHLDGARLWNAAIAGGDTLVELCAGFDLISVCLSKGLGAPVGSMLCGRRDLVHRGHRVRKMFGGGMRQAGILAAAGLYALEHHRERLAEDHANATFIAEALSEYDGLTVTPTETNIVVAKVADKLGTAAQVVDACGARGVLFYTISADTIRLVTHLDIGRLECERAVTIIKDAVSGG